MLGEVVCVECDGLKSDGQVRKRDVSDKDYKRCIMFFFMNNVYKWASDFYLIENQLGFSNQKMKSI